MTNEKAIEKLELMRQKVDEETYRALILAIKALEQELCEKPTTEDAIKTIQELMIACTPDSKYYKVGQMAISAMLENEELSKDLDEALREIDEYEQGLEQEPQCTEHPCLRTLCRYYKQPCDDAVSREELLKAIETWDKFGVDDTNSLFRLDNLSLPHYVPYIHYDDVIKCIKGMPSVQPKRQDWIPVSERLPEEYRFVNCTCRSLIDDREDWVVETVYIPQPSNSPYSDWGNIPMLNYKQCEVIAWMYREIPEPYRAESEE